MDERVDILDVIEEEEEPVCNDCGEVMVWCPYDNCWVCPNCDCSECSEDGAPCEEDEEDIDADVEWMEEEDEW